MDRSKFAVLFIIVAILIGVASWSWVNLFVTPEYNPEVAHEYLERFYMRCDARFDESVCDDAVGNHHRSCFTGHLEYDVPQEEGGRRTVHYDFDAYLDCMNQGVEVELNGAGR